MTNHTTPVGTVTSPAPAASSLSQAVAVAAPSEPSSTKIPNRRTPQRPPRTNAEVLSGSGGGAIHDAYRALVAAHPKGHDGLCTAYGLDTDDVNGGTYWLDVIRQAILHGDIDADGNVN